MKGSRYAVLSFVKRHALLVCSLIAAWTAMVPVARAFFRVEVDYNEGWNIYNASTVAQHHWLYPVKYGWTTVNYPMLSFVVMAWLHRVTHEYLFTARAVSLLSLIACGVLVGAIVRRLGGSMRASVLAGMYCMALFCAAADAYVGMDDPQMFAQVFFLGGLLVFLRDRRSFAGIAWAALLFVVGGCVKHNPIDFPLAVVAELALVSARRALWFCLCGVCFAGIAVLLHLHFGGPEFFGQLLAPRVYLIGKVPDQFVNVFGPLLLPFGVAIYMAIRVRADERRRIAAILLVTTIVVGGYFGGGKGVSINCLFSALLAVAILVGLFWDDVCAGRLGWARPVADYTAVILFGWLTIPMIVWGNWNPVSRLREIAAEERRFDSDVAFLQSRPGPAICESLLRCVYAGKDYEYDPFNATRLIEAGKLDGSVMVAKIRERRFGAVEVEGPLDEEIRSERFTPAILEAIRENYVPAMTNEDGAIYIPRER